jgi:hypothetical protein
MDTTGPLARESLGVATAGRIRSLSIRARIRASARSLSTGPSEVDISFSTEFSVIA